VIGREDVRWKDLRGVFPTYYLLASGGDIRSLQQILGHAGPTMTIRYLRHLLAGNTARLTAEARRIGLPGGRSHLHLAQGASRTRS
jgi:integrase